LYLHRSKEDKQKPRGVVPAGFLKNLAIPTFASALTIIGPKRLTTVFGMGTGVSTWVWSPEEARRAVKPGRAWQSGVFFGKSGMGMFDGRGLIDDVRGSLTSAISHPTSHIHPLPFRFAGPGFAEANLDL
jgi:hypothetical protein